jgi:NTP pyrophosphatase (non-canonical NTP hydrolase)
MIAQRIQITEDNIDRVLTRVRNMIATRLATKGRGAYASYHEAFGIIYEEVAELAVELQKNDKVEFENECMDVLNACFFALVSIEAARNENREATYKQVVQQLVHERPKSVTNPYDVAGIEGC